ncbi:MAG: chitosanase, partial [Anaerolineae bacterium]|nr:chitosanase [Anaerolineae bacterium]
GGLNGFGQGDGLGGNGLGGGFGQGFGDGSAQGAMGGAPHGGLNGFGQGDGLGGNGLGGGFGQGFGDGSAQGGMGGVPGTGHGFGQRFGDGSAQGALGGSGQGLSNIADISNSSGIRGLNDNLRSLPDDIQRPGGGYTGISPLGGGFSGYQPANNYKSAHQNTASKSETVRETVRTNDSGETGTGRHQSNFSYAAGITAEFEGRYDSVQQIDKAVISYGRFQFTLTSGNLSNVLRSWRDGPTSQGQAPKAWAIINASMDRVTAQDASLADNNEFKNALRQAGRTQSMREAQDNYGQRNFFDPAVKLANREGVQSRVGQAIYFDTYIQGPRGLRSIIEKTRAAIGDEKMGEQAYLNRFLDERAAYMLRLADQNDIKAQQSLNQAKSERASGNAAKARNSEKAAERYQHTAQMFRNAPERRVEQLRQEVNREFTNPYK